MLHSQADLLQDFVGVRAYGATGPLGGARSSAEFGQYGWNSQFPLLRLYRFEHTPGLVVGVSKHVGDVIYRPHRYVCGLQRGDHFFR